MILFYFLSLTSLHWYLTSLAKDQTCSDLPVLGGETDLAEKIRRRIAASHITYREVEQAAKTHQRVPKLRTIEGVAEPPLWPQHVLVNSLEVQLAEHHRSLQHLQHTTEELSRCTSYFHATGLRSEKADLQAVNARQREDIVVCRAFRWNVGIVMDEQ